MTGHLEGFTWNSKVSWMATGRSNKCGYAMEYVCPVAGSAPFCVILSSLYYSEFKLLSIEDATPWQLCIMYD